MKSIKCLSSTSGKKSLFFKMLILKRLSWKSQVINQFVHHKT